MTANDLDMVIKEWNRLTPAQKSALMTRASDLYYAVARLVRATEARKIVHDR